MNSFFKKFIYKHWQNFHSIRRFELDLIKKYLELNESKEKILDLGCGKGFFCELLNDLQNAVFGIDPELSNIETAKTYLNKNIVFKQACGEDIPFEDNFFDKVTSICVLEHVNDPNKVLSEVNRVLKHDGIFAFSVDSLNSPYISENFINKHRKKYNVNFLFDVNKIEKLLSENGFKLIDSKYLFNSKISALAFYISDYFKYKGLFFLLFPLIYPILFIDSLLNKNSKNGMILVLKAKKIT